MASFLSLAQLVTASEECACPDSISYTHAADRIFPEVIKTLPETPKVTILETSVVETADSMQSTVEDWTIDELQK